MGTRFGTIAAWAAFPMAAMFAVNAYFQFATNTAGWAYAGAAIALAVGGFRTLRKMSGGLRLLAAAWGFAAALLLPPNLALIGEQSPLAIAFVLIAFAGAALTVLHKEKK